MVTSKLEVLVDFGQKPDVNEINQTLTVLKSQDHVKQAVYKDGALMVETTLPSSTVLDIVSKTSGRRAVLQGFGDAQSAVAMISSQSCCRSKVLGVIRFQQADEGSLVIEGSVDGLPEGRHGLYVHEAGDLSEGCKSIGGHYDNTAGQTEAGKYHAGDVGHIVADDTGRSTFRIVDSVLKVWDIVGRSVAITEGAAECGAGDGRDNVIGGNCGQPVACGIIARASGIFQNPKRICACDGVVVWDEHDRPIAGKGRRDKDTCCKKETQDVENKHKNCCKF